MGIWDQSWESTVSQDANPHQKGCYTHASCKFALEQIAIVRSDFVRKGERSDPTLHLHLRLCRPSRRDVREELRALGTRREIIYEADEDTLALRYGSDYTPKYRA
jgi:hypothetical protein